MGQARCAPTRSRGEWSVQAEEESARWSGCSPARWRKAPICCCWRPVPFPLFLPPQLLELPLVLPEPELPVLAAAWRAVLWETRVVAEDRDVDVEAFVEAAEHLHHQLPIGEGFAEITELIGILLELAEVREHASTGESPCSRVRREFPM